MRLDRQGWRERAGGGGRAQHAAGAGRRRSGVARRFAAGALAPLDRGVYERVRAWTRPRWRSAGPGLSVIAAGTTSVLDGVFDDDAMRTVARRLNLPRAR